jgi:hypothetical protein
MIIKHMAPKLKRAIVEYIMGSRSLTIIGQPQVLAVIYEAARTSRVLKEALESGDISATIKAVEDKRRAVERFEKITGKTWGI